MARIKINDELYDLEVPKEPEEHEYQAAMGRLRDGYGAMPDLDIVEDYVTRLQASNMLLAALSGKAAEMSIPDAYNMTVDETMQNALDDGRLSLTRGNDNERE